MEHKLLTVAIPTYNRAKYLKRSLGSVVSQYDERIEIIVSDNASEDNTRQVVEEYASSVPIRYVRNEQNIGGEANFLQCYRMAAGDFILLLGDDDLIIENRLAVILDFLEKNPQSVWVFMNFISVRNEYIDADHYASIWSQDKAVRANVSKYEFLDYAKNHVTFMSCQILSCAAFRQVKNPEQYMPTYFLQTCLGFEATQNDDASRGIIGIPCIANDAGEGEDRQGVEASVNPKNLYRFFGECMEYVLCTLGVKFGYDKKLLIKAWKNGISYWHTKIIEFKAATNGYMKEEFYRYAYPVLKKYPSMYLKVMPAVLMPNWMARLLDRYVKPACKKIKAMLRAARA